MPWSLAYTSPTFLSVDRFTKTKKTTYTGFELFRVKERECPMEVLELEVKTEKIIAFAWEPQGHRFCIIHGEGARPDVSFYTMRDGGGSKLKHLATFKGKSANAIFWSPAGRHLVLAGLKGLNGQLEFFSADEMETLATAEHFMCTDVDWDPTGRYVATSVTAVHAMENGFNVWSFNGQLLYRLPRDRFFQFLWRPRPPCMLSEDQQKEVRLMFARVLLAPPLTRAAAPRLPETSRSTASATTRWMPRWRLRLTRRWLLSARRSWTTGWLGCAPSARRWIQKSTATRSSRSSGLRGAPRRRHTATKQSRLRS